MVGASVVNLAVLHSAAVAFTVPLGIACVLVAGVRLPRAELSIWYRAESSGSRARSVAPSSPAPKSRSGHRKNPPIDDSDRQRARLHPNDANVLAGQEHPEVVWVAREHDAVGGAMAVQPRDRRSGH